LKEGLSPAKRMINHALSEASKVRAKANKRLSLKSKPVCISIKKSVIKRVQIRCGRMFLRVKSIDDRKMPDASHIEAIPSGRDIKNWFNLPMQ